MKDIWGMMGGRRGEGGPAYLTLYRFILSFPTAWPKSSILSEWSDRSIMNIASCERNVSNGEAR